MSAGAPELFLKVKLIRPPVREQRVPRPRLNRRLDGAFAFPVTLICAPAGYGKTTLLVDWISTRSEPVAWLTLGPEENDAACFLNYFLLALQTANPALGRLAQMTAVNIPGADTRDSFLRLLVNELSEVAEPLAIVLDDYHRIEAEEVHRLLDTLVEHLPPELHVIFSSRVEPLMSLLGERRGLDLPPAERAYLEALWSAWCEEQGERASAPTAPEEAWIKPLSRREIEVLRALAEGRSNQEIAARLVLSLNTVKKHVSTIMGKLNAKNRTQAVLLARRLGLLE